MNQRRPINWLFAIKTILVLPFMVALFALPVGLWTLFVVSCEYWSDNIRSRKPHGIFFHAKKEFTDF